MSNVKPFKSINDQIELLRSRGLLIPDKEKAKLLLYRHNYYRLSGYTLTLREKDKFCEGVTLDDVMQIYFFDSELRGILLSALEHVEISLRTSIGYHHSKLYGPLGYINSKLFTDKNHHDNFMTHFKKSLRENERNEIFIRHHKANRDNEFPIWVVVEVLSFGTLSKLFKIMNKEVNQDICREKYNNISHYFISSWMHCLSILRNICAHRARLYNRNFSMGPRFCREDKEMFINMGYENTKIGKSLFFYLFILAKVVDDQEVWNTTTDKIDTILKKYPFVKVSCLGFPPNWKEVLNNANKHIITITDPTKPLDDA